MNIDDFKRTILGGGSYLDEETIDILNVMIQIQSVNSDFLQKRNSKGKS
jgi:hypothetical protein